MTQSKAEVRHVVAALLTSAVLFQATSAAAAPGVAANGRASWGAFYSQTNGPSMLAGMSDDGRFVTYVTTANNITDEDPNTRIDVYRYDTLLGITLLVSKAATGGLSGNQGCPQHMSPNTRMISPDGRYVLFTSYATDLITSGDNNSRADVFVRDMDTATNQRVSLGVAAAEIGEDSFALGMSADARRISFATRARVLPQDTNALWDIYMFDRQLNQTTLVSSNASGLAVGTPESAGPPMAAISASGIHVVFTTGASLNTRDTNPGTDVYWKDITTGITKLATTKADGRAVDHFNADGATVSGDGRYVAFHTAAPLVPEDSNWTRDVYVKDIALDGITRMSTKTGGAQVADPRCQSLSLSGNGNVVSMMCQSNELVTDTQNFMHIYTKARDTNATALISRVAAGGALGNNDNPYSIVSKDGSRLAITARSSNFVSPDTNAAYDVFIASRQ